MLKSITWSNLATAAVLLIALWYAIILFVYYRIEVFNLFSGKYKIPTRKKKQVITEDTEEEPGDQEHTFEQLEGIVTDIRHSIFEEAATTPAKQRCLRSSKQDWKTTAGYASLPFG